MKNLASGLFMAGLLVAPAFMSPAFASDAASKSASTTAQAELPAVLQAKRLLKALSTGDDASFLRTVHAIYPKTKSTDAHWLDLRGDLNKLKFHGIAKANATEADLTAFDGNRMAWALVSVTVDAKPPHAITSFSVRSAPRPADVAAPPKLQPKELVAATRAKAKEDAAADKFSGAVLIGQKGKVLFEAAYGMANRTAKTPNTINTKFRVGSMDKMFTSVAIMQLAQAGKLDLDAPVGRYIPDYPNKDVAAKVTINELMVHAGGVGDFFGPEFVAHHDSLREPKDYIALLGKRAPEFEPGSRQDYSNYGFIILGRVVEKVSGQSYDAYVQQHIFKPAGMVATGALPESVNVPNRAIGYTQSGKDLVPATKDQVWRGTPAGGGYSTVEDMFHFANALIAHKLLNAAYTKKLTSGTATMPGGQPAHYDFAGFTEDGRLFFGHNGGAPGQNGELRIFADNGTTIAVLANRDPPAATAIAAFISDRLP